MKAAMLALRVLVIVVGGGVGWLPCYGASPIYTLDLVEMSGARQFDSSAELNWYWRQPGALMFFVGRTRDRAWLVGNSYLFAHIVSKITQTENLIRYSFVGGLEIRLRNVSHERIEGYPIEQNMWISVGQLEIVDGTDTYIGKIELVGSVDTGRRQKMSIFRTELRAHNGSNLQCTKILNSSSGK